MSVGVQCEFLIEIDQPTTSTASPKSGYLLRVARAEDKRKYLVWCVEVSTMRLILNTRLRELAAAARGSQDVAFDLKPRNVLIYQIIYLFHDHMEHPADLSHVREKIYFPQLNTNWQIKISRIEGVAPRALCSRAAVPSCGWAAPTCAPPSRRSTGRRSRCPLIPSRTPRGMMSTQNSAINQQNKSSKLHCTVKMS